MDENSAASQSSMRSGPSAAGLGLAILLLIAVRSSAAPVALLWDPTPDARAVGYTVHYGTESGRYTSHVDVGNAIAYTVAGLSVGLTYFFAVSAYDASGGVSAYSEEVSAEVTAPPSLPPAAPVAAFEAYPTSGAAPLTVAFNGFSSGAVNAYVWDFGDGNASAFGSGTLPASTTHTYAAPGSYSVRLSVTGPGGSDVIVKSNLIVAVASTPEAPYACPCSLWDASAVPHNPSVASTAGVNVGVRFTSVVDGYVTAIRFYKGQGNVGPHVADIWTGAGQRLATATFLEVSESGWQQVDFAVPLLVKAGTAYVASYHAPKGRHASDNGYFLKVVKTGPLRALAHSSVRANGLYAYGPVSMFPGMPAKQTNYWVDIVFVPVDGSRKDTGRTGR